MIVGVIPSHSAEVLVPRGHIMYALMVCFPCYALWYMKASCYQNEYVA
jgi:hypothetical protein